MSQPIVECLRVLRLRHLFGPIGAMLDALAASLRIDLRVIVFCDNSLNRIELKQARGNYPSWGILIEPTDIAQLSRFMGCKGAMVASVAALERVVAQERPSDRLLAVGAQVDAAQYAARF